MNKVKMKKTKIYLQYPWKYGDSSYYKNLLGYPLKDVSYLNPKFKTINSKIGFNLTKFIKKPIRNIVRVLNIPNIVRTKSQYSNKADLIHCAHCLSLNNKPWIVDFERYETLSADGSIARSEKGIRKITKLLKSENCKKILPWTNAAKKSILDYIGDEEVEKKIELLPFALPLKKYKSRRQDTKVHILFVARYFEAKGGYVALRVIDYLTKKYENVYGIFVSETPNNILEKYSENKKIEFHELMPQEKLFNEIYPKSDIFFYPGFSDTFGFSLVESLAFKLPIISFEGFARDEIVEDGKNGYIIKKKQDDEEIVGENWREFRKKLDEMTIENQYIRQAIGRTERLILNKSLRERMGEYGYKMVKNGKFSIQNRDKILKKIYKEALK